MSRILRCVILLLVCFSQARSQERTGLARPPGSDTMKVVELLHADRLSFERVDSVSEFQTLAGHVRMKHEGTLFYCDSAVYNKSARYIEAFGNVHINDRDSVHTYSQYLLYYVDSKTATLKNNVKLTDGKTTLLTEELQYDINQRTGEYHNGGKLINENSVLTSKEGVYYADLKDVYFKKNVELKDPRYFLKTDSLLYNTATEITTFIAKTYIKDSAGKTIETSDGYYDLKNKRAYFGKRPIIKDGAVTIIANDVETNDSTGISRLRGNAVYVDTAQGVSVLANYIETNRDEESFLAYQQPLMILKQDNDSIYIAADTLSSGRLSKLQAQHDSVKTVTDSSAVTLTKSSKRVSVADSATKMITDKPGDSLTVMTATPGTAQVTAAADSAGAVADTSALRPMVVDVNKNDSSDRYFRAWHNVRIFSDSLQAVSDSLFYSGKDSIFRLFTDPIIWANNSQVTGDTIYLYTKNKKAERLHVFEDGMAINKSGEEMYNQIRGNQLNGYFHEGNIDYMRAQGNAESIYYVLDDDSAVVGVNKASSDIIDMRFKDKELYRVVFISEVTGTMMPLGQATEQDKYLRNFKWQEARRPKTKFELFGY